MRKDRGEPEYYPETPPLDRAEYLLGWFYQVGPSQSGGLGEGPLSFGEMESWARMTGAHVTPWDVGLLRRLSVEYLQERHRATKADAEPPWKAETDDEITQIQRESVARGLRNVMRSYFLATGKAA